MRIAIITVLAVAGIVLTSHQSSHATLQATPAQQYNSACLAYGNEVPCSLVQ